MKKIIVYYDKERYVVIDCTGIKASEYGKALDEIESLGFIRYMIDADGFRAKLETRDKSILEKLKALGYTF